MMRSDESGLKKELSVQTGRSTTVSQALMIAIKTIYESIRGEKYSSICNKAIVRYGSENGIRIN